MKRKLIAALLLSCSFITGCGGTTRSATVSKEEYDAVVKERDEYKSKYETLLESSESVNPSSDSTPEETSSNEPDASDSNNITSEELTQNLSISSPYTWSTSFYSYAGFEVTNNSSETIRLDSEFVFYDANNAVIGSKSDQHPAIAPGQTVLLRAANESEFDHCELRPNPSVDNSFISTVSDLSNTVSDTDDKLVYSITNSGEFSALFAECTVAFFRGGQIVGVSDGFAIDSENEIKPGNTEYAEISKPYKTAYDEYKLYLEARAYK